MAKQTKNEVGRTYTGAEFAAELGPSIEEMFRIKAEAEERMAQEQGALKEKYEPLLKQAWIEHRRQVARNKHKQHYTLLNRLRGVKLPLSGYRSKIDRGLPYLLLMSAHGMWGSGEFLSKYSIEYYKEMKAAEFRYHAVRPWSDEGLSDLMDMVAVLEMAKEKPDASFFVPLGNIRMLTAYKEEDGA